jgi:hypothetical protein
MTRRPMVVSGGEGLGVPASPSGHSGSAPSPDGLGHAVSVPNAEMLWPVYEFRPLPRDTRSTVLRYADGQWLPDDGEWDLAFVAYGWGAPLGIYVDLPYQRNIVWRGLTSHWSADNHDHPRANPWHYMLRDGETEWGGPWGRARHPNRRAGNAAMDKCCAINRCANGTGPQFELGDPYIAAGLIRERNSKRLVTFPAAPSCMYCGLRWSTKIAARTESAQ